MIVFDLTCDNGHTFEGWFGTSDDFAGQQRRGLVTCPVCASAVVAKAPMAPAVPTKRNGGRSDANLSLAGGKLPAEIANALKALAAVQAKALASSEWVGDRFASEVRSMHYGEKEEKQVHGRATKDDAAALMDEGIAVAPLLVPVHPPEDLN